MGFCRLVCVQCRLRARGAVSTAGFRALVGFLATQRLRGLKSCAPALSDPDDYQAPCASFLLTSPPVRPCALSLAACRTPTRRSTGGPRRCCGRRATVTRRCSRPPTAAGSSSWTSCCASPRPRLRSASPLTGCRCRCGRRSSSTGPPCRPSCGGKRWRARRTRRPLRRFWRRTRFFRQSTCRCTARRARVPRARRRFRRWTGVTPMLLQAG